VQQKRSDRTVVEGYGDVYVTCDSATERWTALVVPSSGTLTKGNAAVTATVVDGPAWVTPATTSRSIKLAESIS